MSFESTIKLSLGLNAEPELQEPLMAILAGIGYYAFEEQPAGLDAYIEAGKFDEGELRKTLDFHFPHFYFELEKEEIPPQDWNAEWEKNWEPVYVHATFQIIPPFQEAKPDFRYTIRINPRMAFGTGHHATTRLMLMMMEPLSLKGKAVLDMGCGTGVLGIAARLMGANEITAIDIDPWSVENTRENAALNEINDLNIVSGNASNIPPGACYDIILANINRNVLLEDSSVYLNRMAPDGILVLSGFRTEDAPLIVGRYEQLGLQPLARQDLDEWVTIAFTFAQAKNQE